MLSFKPRALASVTGIALLAFLAADLSGMGPKPPKEDSTVSLVRPDGAPDDDAKGTLRIRSDKKGERFDVKVEKVDVSLAHELFMEDPADSDTFVLVTGLDGSGDDLKFSIDTKKGDALPLGALDNDELIGRRVEVRVGSDVVLEGTVPPFGLSKKPAKAKVDFLAESDGPAPDMKATLKLRSKADKGQERFDLKVKKAPFDDDGPFHVVIEDAVGSGVFVDVGDVDQTSGSEGRFRRDTKQGQALPLEVGFVIQLAGRAIEVRDEGDVTYLAGVIPSVD